MKLSISLIKLPFTVNKKLDIALTGLLLKSRSITLPKTNQNIISSCYNIREVRKHFNVIYLDSCLCELVVAVLLILIVIMLRRIEKLEVIRGFICFLF